VCIVIGRKSGKRRIQNKRGIKRNGGIRKTRRVEEKAELPRGRRNITEREEYCREGKEV